MATKKVCINVNPLCKEYMTGIERYTYEMVSRLEALLAEVGISLEYIYAENGSPRMPPGCKGRLTPLLGRQSSVSFSRSAAAFLKDNDALYLNCSGGIPLGRGVVVIHDVRPYACREFDPWLSRMKFRFALGASRHLARQVVTVSEFSKEELIAARFDSKKIAVAGCGWEHIEAVEPDETVFDEIQDISLGEYYYALGSRAPHKNLRWVLEMAARNPSLRFVVTGKRWTDGDAEIASMPNVTYTGYVSDGKSKALMQHCKAFLQPSRYEGFGIPPLEAAACGAPLVLSKAASLPEVFGDAAVYFDPLDYEVNLPALADKAAMVTPDVRKELLARHSWERYSRILARLLIDCCSM